MARRRTPPSTPTPAELTRFDPDEWSEVGDTHWKPGFKRWKQARHTWLHEHPDSMLGDAVDVFRVEHLTLVELENWRPSAPQPAVEIRPKPA
jgi:hypothetical protein